MSAMDLPAAPEMPSCACLRCVRFRDQAKRGLITVVHREKLKAKAGGSYGTAEAKYERLFGPAQAPSDTKIIPFPG